MHFKNIGFIKMDVFRAVRDGDLLTVSRYFSTTCNTNRILNTNLRDNLLLYACDFNTPEIITYLVSIGADLHARDALGYTTLHILCKHASSLPTIQFLIAAGAPLCAQTTHGHTPFQIACYNNNSEIAFYLGTLMIEKGYNINSHNKNGLTALHLACFHGFLKVVKMLLSLGADPYILTPEGDNAFNIACKHDRKEVVEYLGSLMYPN